MSHDIMAAIESLRALEKAAPSEVAASRAVIQEMREHCLCDRFEVKGFDYGEEHKKLGKPGPGKRWLTPVDLADVYLLNTRDVTGAGLSIPALLDALTACVESLQKIADPRKRDHYEPDTYTQLCCVMNIADETLSKVGKILRKGNKP